ncbi:MAG TPA: VCBS repeat-containing protein, partial [Planctomycetaceae bacterium]|nr:VCBS repeat-containing protein [Planctomycetaceae bacterium]
KHEIYPPVPQPTARYADNFFSWIYDFNNDGNNDIFVVGFPGTPAYVYQNPGPDGLGSHWKKHQVFDWVSNESPQLIDLVGDERPELVCTRDGFFGYATIDWDKPFEPWSFHAISEKITATRFGHGLGIGDINGDGRQDIIHAGGWFEQPADNPGNQRWQQHEAKFTNAYGGAEMYAYDVDGDGDNDVITSLAAHDFGLAWYEQKVTDGDRSFEMHLIMGDRPEQNKYGLVFSELHSVALADIDGDGLKDIVTGKTYWSHHDKSPMWDAGAVAYWFKLVRGPDGVDWIPFQADDDSGIGRQLGVADLDGDGLLDLYAGGMKGTHVLCHSVKSVEKEVWEKAQPKVFKGETERSDRGPKSEIDSATGRIAGALEGESLKVLKVGQGKVAEQKMGGFKADRWSGDAQLFWTGAKP